MRPRSPHPARTLTVLALAIALLPGLFATARASTALDELPGPREVSTVGGYRTIAVAFLAPEGREGLGAPTSYQYALDGAWRRLAVEPTGDGLLRGSISLTRDARAWAGALRAGYGQGRFSEPVDFDAATHGPPESTGAVIYPVDGAVVLAALDPSSPSTRQDGWRMVAEPVRRGLPTRTTRCDTATTCTIGGLRNGVRYEVTFAAYDRFEVDGASRRIEAQATSEVVVPSRGPRAPRMLEAVTTDRGVRLTWTGDLWLAGQPVAGVQVRLGGRWRTVTATHSEGDFFGPLLYTAELPGLSNARAYALRVRALAPGTGTPGAASRQVVVRPVG